MIKTSAAFILLVLLVLTFPGCTLEDVAQHTDTAADAIQTNAPNVPLPYKWIAYLGAGILYAVSSTCYGLRQTMGKRNMKKAITAHSTAIDLAKHAPQEEVRNAAKTTCEYLAQLRVNGNPIPRKDLQTFDAVRKGLL